MFGIFLVCCLLPSLFGIRIQLMKPVTVDSSFDKVTLPCLFKRSTRDNNVLVNWSFGDEHGPIVLLREMSGELFPGYLFKGRVAMDGISSLVLYGPRAFDTGVYTCTVTTIASSHSTEMKSVLLTVKDKPPDFLVVIGLPIVVVIIVFFLFSLGLIAARKMNDRCKCNRLHQEDEEVMR